MRKGKSTSKTLFVFLLVAAFFAFPSVEAHAQERQECNLARPSYAQLQESYTVSMRRTQGNFFTAFMQENAFQIGMGASTEQVSACLNDLHAYIAEIDPAAAENIPAECLAYDEKLCTNLVNAYASTETPDEVNGGGKHNGSLLAISNVLDYAADQPPPVNLAFFVNKKVESIPYMGTALAQSDYTFSGPFLEIIYTLWSIVANAALGVLAIGLLVTGVMIMTKRQLGPQTAVTVQYALPRILLAIILIFFSYIIGAFMASLGWALANSMRAIVTSLGGLTGGELAAAWDIAALGIGIYLLSVLYFLAVPGVGLTIVTIIGVVLLLIIVMKVILDITKLIVYLKMLMHIIFSPLTFAYGAIPGNEKNITGWFKQMGAYVAGLAALAAAETFTLLVAAYILLGQLGNDSPEITVNAFLTSLMLPFVLIFGFHQARKMPKKVEDMIMGPKR